MSAVLPMFALLAGSGAQAAEIFAWACVDDDPSLNIGPTCDYPLIPLNSGVQITSISDAQSDAVGISGFGFFKGETSASIVATGRDALAAWGQASAQMGWRDTFTISNATLNGTAGTATFGINISVSSVTAETISGTYNPGYCEPPGCATALNQWTLDVTAGPDGQEVGSVIFGADDADSGPFGDGPGLYFYTVPIVFGLPANLWVTFDAFATASGSVDPIGAAMVTATSSLLFMNTVEWGGITEVRDGGGNLVSEYSVSSDSTADYSQHITAVPLPGAIWLMVSALAGLSPRLRHRWRS